MLVDGVLADAELAGDLLGREMPVHQAEDLALPRRQPLDQVGGVGGLGRLARR
jgi:hypothetical protein